MAEIHEIAPRRDVARKTKKILGRVLRHHLDFHGDDLAGFAIVTWDMRGGGVSGFLAENGMVSESLMPAFVHDALNRHLAVVIAERSTSERITPDDA